MAIEIQPPQRIPTRNAAPCFFLAGSAIMGRRKPGSARSWRRWSPRLRAPEPAPDPVEQQNRAEAVPPGVPGQFEWELDGQEAADFILMYFALGTRAPITLLELGLFAKSGKLLVCCPEGAGAAATWK